MKKNRVLLDRVVVKILSNILESLSFSNSKNIDFTIAIIGARDNSYITEEASVLIKRYLDPKKYPKSKNKQVLKKYLEYEYVHKYVTMALNKEKNIKSRLQPFYARIII